MLGKETFSLMAQAIKERPVQRQLPGTRAPLTRELSLLTAEALLLEECMRDFRETTAYIWQSKEMLTFEQSVLEDGRIHWLQRASELLNCSSYEQLLWQPSRFAIIAARIGYLEAMHNGCFYTITGLEDTALESEEDRLRFRTAADWLPGIWQMMDRSRGQLKGYVPVSMTRGLAPSHSILLQSKSSKGKINASASASQSPRDDFCVPKNLVDIDTVDVLAFSHGEIRVEHAAVAMLYLWLRVPIAALPPSMFMSGLETALFDIVEHSELIYVQAALYVTVSGLHSCQYRGPGPRDSEMPDLANLVLARVLMRREAMASNVASYHKRISEAFGIDKDATDAETSQLRRIYLLLVIWNVSKQVQAFANELDTGSTYDDITPYSAIAKNCQEIHNDLHDLLTAMRDKSVAAASVTTWDVAVSNPISIAYASADAGMAESGTTSDDSDEEGLRYGDSEGSGGPFIVGSPLEISLPAVLATFAASEDRRGRSVSTAAASSPPKASRGKWFGANVQQSHQRRVSMPNRSGGGFLGRKRAPKTFSPKY